MSDPELTDPEAVGEAGSGSNAVQRRSRLDFLSFGRPPQQPARATPAASAGWADRADRWLGRFEEALGGRREVGPGGEHLVLRRLHPASETYGGRLLSELLSVPGEALGLLAREPAPGCVDPRRVAFLDTETTGLAGGTGTKAFLVGIAYFEADELHVEQHFLPDYDAEAAFLDGAGRALARFEALVTFNGKSFDLPLLDTRLALLRRRADWLGRPHLDLLHPARRVWRRRLEVCSLAALEERVLGVTRGEDVPGWLIPGLYFGFLRTGRLEPLEPVFEHNRQDLLSLVLLAVRLGQAVAGREKLDDPLDEFGLGRLLEDLGLRERSLACYEAALAGDLDPEERAEVQARLGFAHKRLRRDAEALATWDAVARSQGSRALIAMVELAKHYEHRARDYARAAEVTRRAIVSLALQSEAGATRDETTTEALERRLRRLEQRLRKQIG